MIRIKTILFFSVFFCFLFSCKQKKGSGYFLKDRWKTKILPYTTLKSNPKNVYEYFYRGIEDINLKPLPTHGSYEYFQFNDSGDVVEYTFHLSAQKTMTWRYRYNGDGYQQIFNDQSTQGFEEKLSINLEKNKDGDFQETEWLVSGGKKKTIIQYENGGNKISRSEVLEGVGYENETVIVEEYDGQKLLSKKINTYVDKSRMNSKGSYYYSSKQWLDSIVWTSGGIISKTVFINNEHGDPLQEIITKNNDTTQYFTRQYLYDPKGNWTRMLEKENKGPKTPANSSPYVMINREIFY